ncbi:hypothetical protein BGW80DRAFT_1285766 [Lactifluus volemus]|nr:hypothetical protein BGW80DRAFT_1285766 [Lactifluus volemus]
MVKPSDEEISPPSSSKLIPEQIINDSESLSNADTNSMSELEESIDGPDDGMDAAAQEKAGMIYISRIPPGMQPAKVRHLMSQYGEVGRVYLQKEDAKRAYLRRKYTTTKKPHYTEGWVEFKDKKVARSVAGLLNAQSIGGKKGTRWRDDVWTLKYLPNSTHEAAMHTAQLRLELSQSRAEQREYLKNVELARRKELNNKRAGSDERVKRQRTERLEDVLSSVF